MKRSSTQIAALLLASMALPSLAFSAENTELKRRAFFGARMAAAEAGTGARVVEILPSGVAAAAGLKTGDLVTAINGKRVNAPNAFAAALRPLRAGDKMAVQYVRDGKLLMAEGLFTEEPRETYSSADAAYDAVSSAKGQRLRTIVTKPKNAPGKLPVIFLAGWLSDDSVEAPNDTKDATALVLRGLAELPGFATFRVDKPGSGDSEGDCAETDFETELAGYRAAFASLARYDFIDPNRIFILGVSNGGGFAPLLPPTPADAARVRGYAAVGGWVKTWFEHMLEIERGRLTLDGRSPGVINAAMKELAGFYDDLLIKGEKPAQIFQRREAAAKLWPGDDPGHLYGRPVAFYQQLQKLNLAEAWSKVKVPTLVLHGQYDWIMARDHSELIAGYVNANLAGAAQFAELPNTGHTFQNYPTLAAAFKGQEQPFNAAVLKQLTAWFTAHRDG